MRLPLMYPYGPRKPAVFPSFLACSILGHISCLARRSSLVRSSANRTPASLHTADTFVLFQMSSCIFLFEKRTITCRCLFSIFLPTLWTMSTASSILSARSGATLHSRLTISALMSSFTVHLLFSL